MLLLRLSGKAVKLARYIQSFQRSKSHSGLLRSPADPCLTSGYISEESDDSSFSFVSLDDGQIFNDDMESDGEILPTPPAHPTLSHLRERCAPEIPTSCTFPHR